MLRTLIPLLLASASLVHAQGAKEAQALFEAMEAKLAAAKTLKASFSSLMGPEGGQLEFKAELLFGEGDLTKFEVKATTPDGMPVEMSLVSDGNQTRMRQVEGEKVKDDVQPTPPNQGKLIRDAFSRLSIVAALFMVRVDKDDDAPLAVENFSLGAKERDGERSLQVIEFDTVAEHGSFRVKLWIDTVTGLPAKRELSNDERAKAIVETYTAIELDPTLPEGAFDLSDAEAKPEAPSPKPAK